MAIPEGAIRFNTDSSKMEVWNGQKWMIVSVSSPNLDGGARGIVMGGNPGVNNIDFFTIPIAGNATDFGDLTHSLTVGGAFGSPVRGVWAAGYSGGNTNIINYIAFATKGDALDYGDLDRSTHRNGSCSNSHGGL